MARLVTLILFVALLATCVCPIPAVAQEKDGNTESVSLQDRLPPKIQKIQEELPAWLKKSANKEAVVLMQKLHEQLKAKNHKEAEKTADTLLMMMGLIAQGVDSGGAKNPEQPRPDSPDEITKRLTEKVERVKAGAREWAANGRDPAEIVETMQDEFQPLIQAGHVVEAEAVLDSVLKKLGVDVNLPAPAQLQEPSDEERLLTRIHRIQKELPGWVEKTGDQAAADVFMKKLREQLADMNYTAAEKTADSILETIGVSMTPDALEAEPPVTANASRDAADPFAAFFPYQLVFLAGDHIALTHEQAEALRERVNGTHPRLEELQVALEGESAALATLTAGDRLDEAAIREQLDKLLDVERETKQLQVGLGVTIQNLLTQEQQGKLRELTRNPDVIAKLEAKLGQRITAKVERVMAGAQRWTESGRDASAFTQVMDEKVRPLMEAERVFEAEAELDRVLVQLDKDAK